VGDADRDPNRATLMTESHHPTPAWLTASEVADQVKVGIKVIYRAARSGQLRSVVVDGRGDYRFKQEWVDAWMESRMMPLRGERR